MKKLTLLLLLLLLPILSPPAPAAERPDTLSLMGLDREPVPPRADEKPPIGRRSDADWDNECDDPRDLTPAFARPYKLYDVHRPQAAYRGWLKLALRGDLLAMAVLPSLIRLHPELQWPVPPEFWEDWVIRLLGEGEGGYILGAQCTLMAFFPAKGKEQVLRKAGDFFLRSALTGHPAGMLGASNTAHFRKDRPFTPPAHPVVHPIPAEYFPDSTEEARYWLTRAADADYWKACLTLGIYYEANSEKNPDFEKAKHYYMAAARNGSGYANQAIIYGKTGNVYPGADAKKLYHKEFDRLISYREFYAYLTLDNLLKDFGRFMYKENLIPTAHVLGLPTDKDVMDAGVKDGRRLYAAWRKRHAGEILQRVSLYAKARARLPEVQADYAAVAKDDASRQFDRDDIDDDLKDLYADGGPFTPDFRWTRDLYRCGQFREAYDGWLELALHGDLFAMATLPAVSRVHPELQWPVPPEFWENWLIDLLGEGEGGYILGAQYAMMTNYTETGTPYAEQKAGEFFLRSALAGHPAGMLGAARTAPYRKDRPFTPPASPAVTPIPARFYADDPSGEGRYWLTRAADEGYWKACILMAQRYLSPQDKGKPDYTRAEQYYERAARGGSYVAASRLSEGAFNGDDAHKTMCERLSTYAPLAFALKSNGYIDGYHGSSAEQNVRDKSPDAGVREAGISESRRLYEEGQASYMRELREREALYAKARARLPEVRAAFDKRLTAGTPAKMRGGSTTPPGPK